ncbi:MAG TPA: hypothetical protein VK116_14450 [Planctomycetota bacterium]|nr:hypothetical protein [Planctomycetota bacterium]
MDKPLYDCNADTVIAMEELGVAVDDILQYAHALLSEAERQALLAGLSERNLVTSESDA